MSFNLNEAREALTDVEMTELNYLIFKLGRVGRVEPVGLSLVSRYEQLTTKIMDWKERNKKTF